MKESGYIYGKIVRILKKFGFKTSYVLFEVNPNEKLEPIKYFIQLQNLVNNQIITTSKYNLVPAMSLVLKLYQNENKLTKETISEIKLLEKKVKNHMITKTENSDVFNFNRP